jgi:hypothetical protein
MPLKLPTSLASSLKPLVNGGLRNLATKPMPPGAATARAAMGGLPQRTGKLLSTAASPLAQRAATAGTDLAKLMRRPVEYIDQTGIAGRPLVEHLIDKFEHSMKANPVTRAFIESPKAQQMMSSIRDAVKQMDEATMKAFKELAARAAGRDPGDTSADPPEKKPDPSSAKPGDALTELHGHAAEVASIAQALKSKD